MGKIMHCLRIAAILFAATTLQARAQTDSAQSAFDPSLRAYSKIVAVIAECGRAYPINVPRAQAYASAFMEIAQKSGAQQSDLKAEHNRRSSEVKITGIRPWCMTARAGLRETGASELFPDR